MALSSERREWIVRVARGGGHANCSEEQLDALTDEELDDHYDRPYRDFFASVSDPEELHIFADEVACHQWLSRGFGIGMSLHVVHHPLCDLGTALMIYWRMVRAEPQLSELEALLQAIQEAIPEEKREERRKRHDELRESEQRTLDSLREVQREIAQRVAGGEFKTTSQPFDPGNDRGVDLIGELRKMGKHLPAQMHQAAVPAGGSEGRGPGKAAQRRPQ